MNSINASGPPPGSLGVAGVQGDMGNKGFAPGVDPRFFQPGQNSGSQFDQVAQQIMARFPPEQRAALMALPRNELALKLKQIAQNGNNPNQMGPPNQQPNGNMPPNAQAMMQAQQRQRMAAAMNNPRAREVMDNLEVPKGIFSAIKGIPEGVSRWRELKAWLPHAVGVSDEVKSKLQSHQFQQFTLHIARNQNQNPAGPHPQQLGGGLGPRPAPEDLARISVTPQDIQQVRATLAPPMRDATDPQIRSYIQTMRWSAQARQNVNQASRPQPGQAQTMTAPTAQPSAPPVAPQGLAPGQPNPPPVSIPESQNNARPIAQPNRPNRPHQPPKPAPQNPSPAVANKKRPMENEAEASLQPPASGPRPGSGAGQPNMDPSNISETQQANLTPEQRQAFEQKKQLYGQLARIMAEEKHNVDTSTYPEVPLRDAAQQNAYKMQFSRIAQAMRQLANQNVVFKWFALVRDEERLRSLFKAVCHHYSR